MNTLIRNTTLHFSRRSVDAYYQPVDQGGDDAGNENRGGRRTFSRRKSDDRPRNMTTSLSFRRDRAKKRQIFLRTYKLASSEYSPEKSRGRKLKKFAIKLKSVVVSVVSFVRFKSLLTSCCHISPPASSSSPVPKRF
ncbi:hypothetical protein U1Q18_001499 [Sarracenia purpurea var. burkii]